MSMTPHCIECGNYLLPCTATATGIHPEIVGGPGQPAGARGVTLTDDQKYKVVDDTYYHAETPMEVIDVLELYRRDRARKLAAGSDQVPRLRIHYGDTATGRDWMDEFDIEGSIGRSTGTQKIPLLINNSRSHGGGAILDHCIVRIRLAGRSGAIPYTHPDYHLDPEAAIERYHALGPAKFARCWGDDELATVELRITRERLKEQQ